MQVTVETGEGLERRVKVQLPSEQVNAEVEKRLLKIARSARLAGFRPGKVPMSVVRQRYTGQVRGEVLGDLLQSSFVEAVNTEKLKPAGQPKFEFDSGATDLFYGYTAVFEVLPDVELRAIEEIEIKRPVVEITEDDVEHMLGKLRQQRVRWNPIEREAQTGDRLQISFEGKVGGEAFDGGSAKDIRLVLGSNTFIDGFETGLIGAAPGTSRTVHAEFPADYRIANLAGKAVDFEVQISSVEEPLLPEIDAEFVRGLGVASGDVQSLRQEVTANMQRELDQKIHATIKQQVMEALVKLHLIEVPKILIDAEVERLHQQAMQEVKAAGHAGRFDLPREIFQEQGRFRVALGLIIAEIVRKNALKADPARIRKTVETLAASYEQPEDVMRWYYNQKEQMAAIESLVLEDRVVDWVMERAKIEDQVTGFVPFMEERRQ